jgi:hypothetical protein
MKTQHQKIVEEPVGKPSNYLSSKFNAMTHGATSKTVVLSSESQEDFDTLLSDVRDRINPNDAVENEFVDQIVFSFWKIRRCKAAEGVFIEKHTSLTNGNERDIDWSGVFCSEFMGKLNRYETTALNQVRKLFDMLTTYRDLQEAKVIDADVSVE